MNKIAIINGNNILGHFLRRFLTNHTTYSFVNINDSEQIFTDDTESYEYNANDLKSLRKLISNVKPSHIIALNDFNSADEEKQKLEIWNKNVLVVEHLAKAATINDCHLMLISNESLFDGASGPYKEDDKPDPLNYYGKARHAAENVVLTTVADFSIVRVPMVFGYLPDVPNMVEKILENEHLSLRDDYLTNPIYAEDAALAIYKIITKQRKGLYCLGGPDYLTPYEWGLKLNQYLCNSSGNISPSYVSISKEKEQKLKFGFVSLKAETDLNVKFMALSSAYSAIRFLIDKRKYDI
jgi:dTDP-4-dehydrorhamnose reductase